MCLAHTIAILLRGYYAKHDPPPDPPFCMPYTLQYWRLQYLVKAAKLQQESATGCGLLSPPLECIFGYIPFLRGWDTVGYSGIQPDIARYVRIQLDTVSYSGIQWICCKMARYSRDTAGYQGYGEI